MVLDLHSTEWRVTHSLAHDSSEYGTYTTVKAAYTAVMVRDLGDEADVDVVGVHRSCATTAHSENS